MCYIDNYEKSMFCKYKILNLKKGFVLGRCLHAFYTASFQKDYFMGKA